MRPKIHRVDSREHSPEALLSSPVEIDMCHFPAFSPSHPRLVFLRGDKGCITFALTLIVFVHTINLLCFPDGFCSYIFQYISFSGYTGR
jgi:hypothetical protein